MNPTVIGADLLNFYCEISPSEVDYKLDNVVLEQPENDDGWKDDIDAKIDAIRKRNIHINFIDQDASELNLEVIQKNHKFPFGHAIASKMVKVTLMNVLIIEFLVQLGDCYIAGVDDDYCSHVRNNYNWIVDEYR